MSKTPLLKTAELAKLTGVSTKTILNWVKERRITGTFVTKRTLRFDWDQVRLELARFNREAVNVQK